MKPQITHRMIEDRLEQIPLLGWHWRAMGIVGIAQSVELIDSLALAFALPTLMQRWSLTTLEAGLLISITYAGQMTGGILAGWLSDRLGRINLLRWSLAALVVLGFCIAWSTTYSAFLFFRFFQGIAMGAELVLAYTYLAEMSATSFRGRLMFGLNVIASIAVAAAAVTASQVIPRFGVAWVFYIAAIVSIPFFVVGRTLPDSPRWLACNGRLEEAEGVVSAIEAHIPSWIPSPPALWQDEDSPQMETLGHWRDLLAPGFAKATICLWLIAASIQSVGICLVGWLPVFFLRSYSISMASTLLMSSISYTAPVLAALIGMFISDRVARHRIMPVGFAALLISLLAMWIFMGRIDILLVAGLAFLTVLTQMFVLLTFMLVSAELYPTRMRGIGNGAVRFWSALGMITVPLSAGLVMTEFGVRGALFLLMVISMIGLTAALTLEFARKRPEPRPYI